MLDFAGLCGTMLDHLRATRGMIGRSRRPTVARFKKVGSFSWKLGGDNHHYFHAKVGEPYAPPKTARLSINHPSICLF
jgi:hypothetical protein